MNPQVYVNRFFLGLVIFMIVYTITIILVCKFIFRK